MLRTSRRGMFRTLPLIALTPMVPGFLARLARGAPADRDGRILVVVQLDGGNDGLNMVVPYRDDAYARNRPTLKLSVDDLVKVSDEIALHPAMGAAGRLLESGRLAIVPGVGYPNPCRSHFESMAIWQTARLDSDQQQGSGWLGLGLDEQSGASATFIGSRAVPVAVKGRRRVASSLASAEDMAVDPFVPRPLEPVGGDGLVAFVRRSMLDAYATSDQLAQLAEARQPRVRYPNGSLANRLKLIARLIKGGYSARVFYTAQAGYDTHSQQAGRHYGLLGALSASLEAFLNDLAEAKLDERVVVLAFSEFGRRVLENDSAGTDHGAAGPVLLAGPSVRPGVHGAYPSLTDLDDGDLKPLVDFRQVYATLLERWLDVPSLDALGGTFAPLDLIRA